MTTHIDHNTCTTLAAPRRTFYGGLVPINRSLVRTQLLTYAPMTDTSEELDAPWRSSFTRLCAGQVSTSKRNVDWHYELIERGALAFVRFEFWRSFQFEFVYRLARHSRPSCLEWMWERWKVPKF